MFGKPANPPAPPPSQAKSPTPVPAPGPVAAPTPKPEPAPMAIADPLPTARKSPAAPSLIAENMTIEGAIKAEGELHVDGTIKGEVRVSRLTIGDAGQIEGTVTADTVEVRGKVVGAITAKQIRLAASAHVDGDITHEQLAIEAGAFFQGRSLKFQRPAAGAAPAAKATEKGPSMKDLAREVAKADADLRPEHVS